MKDIEQLYREAVTECLAKQPKKEDYDIEDGYFEDKLAWQRETCTRLLTLNNLLPEDKKRI